jgi:hypothetical protein
MMSKDSPNVFFLMDRFMSSNSADAGSSILAATVVFAFFRTGSEASGGRPDGGASTFVAMVVFAFSVDRPGAADSELITIGESVLCSLDAVLGWAVDRFAAFTATDDDFSVIAVCLDLTFVVARLGLIGGAGFSSIGGLAAVLYKQPFEVHPSSIACGGIGQLQPIKVANRAPMRSVLMQFPSSGSRSHFNG